MTTGFATAYIRVEGIFTDLFHLGHKLLGCRTSGLLTEPPNTGVSFFIGPLTKCEQHAAPNFLRDPQALHKAPDCSMFMKEPCSGKFGHSHASFAELRSSDPSDRVLQTQRRNLSSQPRSLKDVEEIIKQVWASGQAETPIPLCLRQEPQLSS